MRSLLLVRTRFAAAVALASDAVAGPTDGGGWRVGSDGRVYWDPSGSIDGAPPGDGKGDGGLRGDEHGPPSFDPCG